MDVTRKHSTTVARNRSYADGFIRVGNISLHYLDYEGEGPPLVLIHSLPANAHVFEGLVHAGLSQCCRLIVPDMRGRGLTDQPPLGYSLEDQAADLTGLLDYLGLEKVMLGGHSLGGLFAFYYAAQYPDRVTRVIALDATAWLHELAPLLITPSLKHPARQDSSWEAYLERVTSAPSFSFWDPEMLPFHQADVLQLPGGAVVPRTRFCTLASLAWHMQNKPWATYISAIRQPVLLLHAPEPYSSGKPVVDAPQMRLTAGLLAHSETVRVTGNHQTMLYRTGARLIVAAVNRFIWASAWG